MKPETFKQELIEHSLSYVASKWVLDRVPHIFDNNRENYILWKEKLSTMIEVDGKSIVFTGSASCGFSLNPNKNYKIFDLSSDIDIAIISQHYFDLSWRTLRNLGTKRFNLNNTQRQSLDDHVSRLIYWGTIATDKILPILPFGKSWIKNMLEMSKEELIENRKINFRIYKDYESLRLYHIQSLEKLRGKLFENQND